MKWLYLVELIVAVGLVGFNSWAVALWLYWMLLTWLCSKILKAIFS